MKNRNKTYAKALLAVAISFSLAAEVTNYALNENRHISENQTVQEGVQERASTSDYQDQLSFWE